MAKVWPLRQNESKDYTLVLIVKLSVNKSFCFSLTVKYVLTLDLLSPARGKEI